ncbi:zinc finger, RING/FYVE/PHD-type [Artemisia annua]|uniref:RING-type E3 ubiquitin transferase n=1 Tax=Artemisia annua TaxID=35608 RepID=A0A2U1L1X6_ARTAN|nr:zinc finger, RING/FYVE/PHD-type [Artemisia annua]
MNTTNTVEPPYPNDMIPGRHDYLYVVGFCSMVLLLIVITYATNTYKRYRSSTTTYSDVQDHHLIKFSLGLNDDVLVTFPTFLYSDAKASYKSDNDTDVEANGSGNCSICLADYKPEDVVRLLPKCGHLFHVKCIDTWLKNHPTCPLCRKMPLVAMVPPKGGDPNS